MTGPDRRDGWREVLPVLDYEIDDQVAAVGEVRDPGPVVGVEPRVDPPPLETDWIPDVPAVVSEQ